MEVLRRWGFMCLGRQRSWYSRCGSLPKTVVDAFDGGGVQVSVENVLAETRVGGVLGRERGARGGGARGTVQARRQWTWTFTLG